MRPFLLALLLLSALIHLPASAADAATVAAIARYDGSDYLQRLVAGAKKEGELTIYTSATQEDIGAINAAFEKKYGVKVKVWRAGADKVLQRVVTEAQGGRYDADVLEAGTPALEAMSREKILTAVKSPRHADLIDGAVPAHREWVGARLNVFVHAYNTKLVKKEDLPKTYQDLLDPKWKGKLGIEATDEEWFASVVRGLGEEAGIKLFRNIVATNGLSVRKGHTLLTNMVASGEVPFALTVYNFTAEQLKQKGASIDWYAIAPAIARANGLGVARRAVHPYAALLFYDFMISEEGQQILANRDFVPTSKKIPSPLGTMPMQLVDPALVLDEEQKWTRLYDDIIVKQAK
jgi:iron(III) transport system substrate-binding protein